MIAGNRVVPGAEAAQQFGLLVVGGAGSGGGDGGRVGVDPAVREGVGAPQRAGAPGLVRREGPAGRGDDDAPGGESGVDRAGVVREEGAAHHGVDAVGADDEVGLASRPSGVVTRAGRPGRRRRRGRRAERRLAVRTTCRPGSRAASGRSGWRGATSTRGPPNRSATAALFGRESQRPPGCAGRRRPARRPGTRMSSPRPMTSRARWELGARPIPARRAPGIRRPAPGR